MKKIKVVLGKRSYNICIKAGMLSSAGNILKTLNIANTAYIITNKKIKSVYGKRLEASLSKQGILNKFHIVPDSEKAKSYACWCKAIHNLADFDKGKGVCVIALGGGVVGDLAGFVASTYRRGVPFIQIPTTLLAQVDSAIGGKVAIDIECAKNLVGAFYQPKVVISDPLVLRSLPPRQIRNGLAEVIKYGIILDKKFFSYLENNISKILKLNPACLEHLIACCSKLKAEVVSADEEEKTGYRSILNFGHTIGHAIEASVSYGKSVNHGEAVAVGMLCAFDIALMLNMAKERDLIRLEALIKKTGLPTRVKGINIAKVIKATSYDKKIIRGKKRWVLPVAIGHVAVCSKVDDSIIREAIKKRFCG
ncbi:MAG: 3-dehydroquinate synthase [Candidatus Omnitrophica bacterium]|nr:3-dehydroquinate synthase [Candidatus Omnitrophota bacterium]